MNRRYAIRITDSLRHKDLNEKIAAVLGLTGVTAIIYALNMAVNRFVLIPIRRKWDLQTIRDGIMSEDEFVRDIKDLYHRKEAFIYSDVIEPDIAPDKFGKQAFLKLKAQVDQARTARDLSRLFPKSEYLKQAVREFDRLKSRTIDSRLYDYGVKGMKKGKRKPKQEESALGSFVSGVKEEASGIGKSVKGSINALERVHNKTTEKTKKKSAENLAKMKGAKGAVLRGVAKIGSNPLANNGVVRKAAGVQMGLGMRLGRKIGNLFK